MEYAMTWSATSAQRKNFVVIATNGPTPTTSAENQPQAEYAGLVEFEAIGRKGVKGALPATTVSISKEKTEPIGAAQ